MRALLIFLMMIPSVHALLPSPLEMWRDINLIEIMQNYPILNEVIFGLFLYNILFSNERIQRVINKPARIMLVIMMVIALSAARVASGFDAASMGSIMLLGVWTWLSFTVYQRLKDKNHTLALLAALLVFTVLYGFLSPNLAQSMYAGFGAGNIFQQIFAGILSILLIYYLFTQVLARREGAADVSAGATGPGFFSRMAGAGMGMVDEYREKRALKKTKSLESDEESEEKKEEKDVIDSRHAAAVLAEITTKLIKIRDDEESIGSKMLVLQTTSSDVRKHISDIEAKITRAQADPSIASAQEVGELQQLLIKFQQRLDDVNQQFFQIQELEQKNVLSSQDLNSKKRQVLKEYFKSQEDAFKRELHFLYDERTTIHIFKDHYVLLVNDAKKNTKYMADSVFNKQINEKLTSYKSKLDELISYFESMDTAKLKPKQKDRETRLKLIKAAEKLSLSESKLDADIAPLNNQIRRETKRGVESNAKKTLSDLRAKKKELRKKIRELRIQMDAPNKTLGFDTSVREKIMKYNSDLIELESELFLLVRA